MAAVVAKPDESNVPAVTIAVPDAADAVQKPRLTVDGLATVLLLQLSPSIEKPSLMQASQ